MAFRYNPATGSWDVVPAGNSAGSTPPAGIKPAAKPAAGPATAKQSVVNIGRVTNPAVNLTQVKPTLMKNGSASGPQPAPSPAKQTAPVSTQLPAGSTTNFIGPMPTPAPMSPQSIVDSMWQSVYDEAAIYRQTYGEEPPTAWWSARTAPIEATQKRLDASTKTSGSGANAAAAARQAELERIRNIKGGAAGEAFLREQAVARKAEMLKRVAELYDPQQTKSAEDLKTVLQHASDAFDLAEKQVGAAQADFTKNFKASTAYEGLPISTFNVADNPLIAALQQQGAGTEQVDAATNYARQFAGQTSDLEKWAASQLGTGQKNFETATQNAAQMGTMAALQGLGQRRADVKSGIEQQFADALAQIGQSRTEATSNVDSTIADIIAKADQMKADTLAKYGSLPVKKTPATVTTPPAKKPAVVKPKVVTPTPTPKANPKLNVR